MRIVTIAVSISILFLSDIFARRGNPRNPGNFAVQYVCIDNDDNHSLRPIYKFVDTNVGTWVRINGFTNNDTGYKRVFPAGSTFTMNHFARSITLPPRYVHANGFISYDTIQPSTQLDSVFKVSNSAKNSLLPANWMGSAYPLWCDLELRTTGDSSRIYYRITSDTCYVSFYNMFLKGTNGRVSATFQVVYSRLDSSVTFMYRSFDGTMNGEPAADIFSRLATIGVQDSLGAFATVYLDRGVYYARSYSGAQYEQQLHNGLAVKFLRVVPNIARIVSIDAPSIDEYELPSTTFTPVITVDNMSAQARTLYINNVVTDMTTGQNIYSRQDSIVNAQPGQHQYTGSTGSGWQCGRYRLTSTVSVAAGADAWVHDNTMTRDFVRVSSLAFPHIDPLFTFDPCLYHDYGGQWLEASSVFYDEPAPYNTGAIVLDRYNRNGQPYIGNVVGDTIITAPVDLSKKQNVYFMFSLQRGIKSDSVKAGIRLRYLLGPEPKVTQNGVIVSGDSLIIEGIPSTAATYNIASSAWQTIAVLYGGYDIQTEKVRISIPSQYIHNHSRFRIRLAARDNGAQLGFPFDDGDAFVIDGLQIAAPAYGNKDETDLEPTAVDLGARFYTHIPRNVKSLYPRVKIASNGLQANQAVYQVRLIIKDQLSREVYHRMQSLVAPAARTDVWLVMPEWIIEGSQGGVFTCKAIVEQTFSDYYMQNDTAIFYRRLDINDSYAHDDGKPDTAGTMTASEHSWFYYDFIPLANDSLRGFTFYHLAPSGLTNWTITIRNGSKAGNVLNTQSVSYTVQEPGFQTATLPTPFYVEKGKKYNIQCNMTQGFGLGGDASKGYTQPLSLAFSTNPAKYTALYDSLLLLFEGSSTGNFYAGGQVLNGASSGPLLPMLRLVFSGSATYLPVDIVSFRAQRTDNGNVLLEFTTAKEEHVDRFLIERLDNDEWTLVSTIPAQNSYSGFRYSAIDHTAAKNAVRYRLRNLDLDGAATVGAHCTAEAFETTPRLDVSFDRLSNNLHIASGEAITTIGIIDAAGKEILSRQNLYLQTYDMNASALTAGVYWVTVEYENGTKEQKKFTVIR
jgi:hypothetical protein